NIRYMLSEYQLRVHVQAIQHVIVIILLNYLLGKLFKAFPIIFCPPVFEIPQLVILASLIIEAMRHFVTNNCSYCSIIDGIISSLMIKWRLKDACRKHNFVKRRIIIGINSWRRHKPFRTVYWFSQFIYHMLILPLSCLSKVGNQRAAVNINRRVIFPFVRITNLIYESIKFRNRLIFGGITHPVQPFYAFAVGLFQVINHTSHILLSFRRKITLYIKLAQCIAQLSVD